MREANHGTAGGTLSQHVREEIDHWLTKFPADRRRSAVIAALHAVQHEHGHLTQEAMDEVAAYLGLPPIQVYEVASFYSMFETSPCGRHHISVCTNISCMLRGGDEIFQHCAKKLSIGHKQTTADRMFSLEEVECLGACCGAPAVQVNYEYYENLTPEKVDELIGELKKKEPGPRT